MFGTLMFVAGASVTLLETPGFAITGLALTTFAVATTFVCFNAYVLDHVAKIELGRFETSRLFYSALGWTVGPALSTFLYAWWRPAPFLIAAVAAAAMLVIFLVMRLGNGKLITKSRRPLANPLAYFGRFAAQPRLVTGWIFAVVRSCGWWFYVVYLPIFAVQNGLGSQLGGSALSMSNAALFLTPLMLRFMQRNSVRTAVRTGFLMSGLLFLLAALPSGIPQLAVVLLMAGSIFLTLLDVSAGLPSLLAVKPSERTEMSAIYSSFRDVSGIMTPGAAWLVLLFAPLSVCSRGEVRVCSAPGFWRVSCIHGWVRHAYLSRAFPMNATTTSPSRTLCQQSFTSGPNCLDYQAQEPRKPHFVTAQYYSLLVQGQHSWA